MQALFKGLDREKIDYNPVLKMAAEYFTHLGIICEQKFSLTLHVYVIIYQCGSYESRRE